MRKCLLILLSLLSFHAFSQLYIGYKAAVYYWVDLKKDSVHVEIFKDHSSFLEKLDDEVLKTQGMNKVLFWSSRNKILNQKNTLYLVNKDASGKEQRIKLQQASKDDRENLRMESYYSFKNTEINTLQDSLAGSNGKSAFTLEKNMDWSTSSDYFKAVDKAAAELSKKINAKADPTALSFYKIMDSVPTMSASDLLEYVGKAKYEFYYGKTLLYRVGVHRPEVLVAHMNKNPSNYDQILLTIKDHKYYKEIIEGVHSWPEKSKAKKDIEKQKRKRMMKDGAYRNLFKGLIVAEVAIVIGLIAFFVSK